MAIAAEKFWRSNHYNHPALTDEMVLVAEQQLGVKLPAEYVALLRIQNGGYTHGFGFPMTQRTTWAKDHVPMNDLAGIVTDPAIRTAQNVLDTAYLTNEWGLPPHQVLISGDGHWWITLDYRKGDVPSVAWIDVECGQDIQIAPTFAAFLEGLKPRAQFSSD
jgi:SMI1-KNR4 cell-wall